MALQWLSLVGTIWLQSISATNSNFPAYSSQLKQLLSLSQLQLNNLAFASDAGKLFGFVSGVAAVYLPLWIVLLIGSALGFVGYGVQYLFLLSDKASSLPYTLVFLLTVLAGNSICWINTVCYVIAIQNFPFDRQLAVGLSTSYQGLSAKIYSDLVDLVFESSSSIQRARSYLLLNCILPLVVCLTASPLVRVIKSPRSRRLSGGFLVIFMITIFTGTYAVITSLGSRTGLCSPSVILIGMCVFLVAPLVVPLMEKLRERMENKCLIRSYGGKVCDESSMEKENGGVVNEHGVKDEGLLVCEEEEMGVKVMIKRLNFWLYFFVYMFGATVGMVYLNNLGQIVESRGSSKTSSLVSLASSFGFFGRIFPCLLDYYISSHHFWYSRIITNKTFGGLGVGRLKDANISLLAKWWWRFKCEPTSLWVRVLSSIHQRGSTSPFLPINKGFGGIWRGIISVDSFLAKNSIVFCNSFRAINGNGMGIRFWEDCWAMPSAFRVIFPDLYRLEATKSCLVTERVSQVDGAIEQILWQWTTAPSSSAELVQLNQCLEAIKSYGFNNSHPKWIWTSAADGKFTTKILKAEIQRKEEIYFHGNFEWNRFVPIKVNFFNWRARVEKIPLKNQLAKRGVSIINEFCSTCNLFEETGDHIFFNCGLAKTVWSVIFNWWKQQSLAHFTSWIDVENFLQNTKGSRRKILQAIIFTTTWSLWKARNKRIFQNQQNSANLIFQEILALSFLWITNRSKIGKIEWSKWMAFSFDM